MKKITFLLLCFVFTGQLFAQKIGYVDYDTLLTKMPEYKSVAADLLTIKGQFGDSMTLAGKKYESLLMAFEKKNAEGFYTKNPDKKEADMKQLSALVEDIARMQDRYILLIEKKENELETPFKNKLNKVIQSYADAHGYSYIFPLNSAIIATTKIPDLTPEITKELGY